MCPQVNCLMQFSFFFPVVVTGSLYFDEAAGSTYPGLLIHAKFNLLENGTKILAERYSSCSLPIRNCE